MRGAGLVLLLGAVCLLTACAATHLTDGRSASMEMTLTVAGTEESTAMKLWQEEDFSMYLPAQGWTQDKDGVWHPEDDQAVSLSVDAFPESDKDAAYAAIVEQHPSYSFTHLEENRFVGYDGVAGMTLWVRLASDRDTCYALWAQYPTAEEETFGAQTQQLAETFETA